MQKWPLALMVLLASAAPSYAAIRLPFEVGLALAGLLLVAAAAIWGFVGIVHLVRWLMARKATAHFTSRFSQLSYPLPEIVRITAIVLVVQGLLRLALLAMPLLRLGFAVFNVYATISVILGFAGIAAGFLALQRMALARVVGLVLCAAGLLYQLYVVANIMRSAAGVHLAPSAWFLIPAFIAVYAMGLLVFAFVPYYRAGAVNEARAG